MLPSGPVEIPITPGHLMPLGNSPHGPFRSYPPEICAEACKPPNTIPIKTGDASTAQACLLDITSVFSYVDVPLAVRQKPAQAGQFRWISCTALGRCLL